MLISEDGMELKVKIIRFKLEEIGNMSFPGLVFTVESTSGGWEGSLVSGPRPNSPSWSCSHIRFGFFPILHL